MKTDSKGHVSRTVKIGSIHPPFYGTCVADFMLRQNARKFMLGTYLSNKEIP